MQQPISTVTIFHVNNSVQMAFSVPQQTHLEGAVTRFLQQLQCSKLPSAGAALGKVTLNLVLSLPLVFSWRLAWFHGMEPSNRGCSGASWAGTAPEGYSCRKGYAVAEGISQITVQGQEAEGSQECAATLSLSHLEGPFMNKKFPDTPGFW